MFPCDHYDDLAVVIRSIKRATDQFAVEATGVPVARGRSWLAGSRKVVK